jgi:hypothetical protein
LDVDSQAPGKVILRPTASRRMLMMRKRAEKKKTLTGGLKCVMHCVGRQSGWLSRRDSFHRLRQRLSFIAPKAVRRGSILRFLPQARLLTPHRGRYSTSSSSSSEARRRLYQGWRNPGASRKRAWSTPSTFAKGSNSTLRRASSRLAISTHRMSSSRLSANGRTTIRTTAFPVARTSTSTAWTCPSC